jgi:hypothetical protein
MIAEYLSLAGDSARTSGPFSGPSLYRPSPRETALQFGALVSKSLAETRFLDPSNTTAINRGEALLQSAASRGGVSRAEIERYYRQGIGDLIAETVDGKSGGKTIPAATLTDMKQRINAFYLNPNQTTFNALKEFYIRVNLESTALYMINLYNAAG